MTPITSRTMITAESTAISGAPAETGRQQLQGCQQQQGRQQQQGVTKHTAAGTPATHDFSQTLIKWQKQAKRIKNLENRPLMVSQILMSPVDMEISNFYYCLSFRRRPLHFCISLRYSYITPIQSKYRTIIRASESEDPPLELINYMLNVFQRWKPQR